MEKIVNLKVNTKDKKFMFNLGMLFARGYKIRIENIEDVQNKIFEEQKEGFAKSFNMMVKYWQDNNLAPNIYTDEINKNGVFIICPVRKASENEKRLLNAYILNFEKQGKIVHYPERDTNQSPITNGVNTGGYNICLQNARAIFTSQTIAIFYNKESVGSMFDLGVTYELIKNDPKRKFQILNFKLELNKNDFIDAKILELFELNKQRNPSLEDLCNYISKELTF